MGNSKQINHIIAFRIIPGQTEDTQILQAISDFIAKHGDSRFSAHHERMEDTIYNRAGWYKDADIGRVYMFLPVALIEAGDGFERSRIIEALKRAKWIVECDAGRATKKVRIRGGLNNLYHICEPGQTCSPCSVSGNTVEIATSPSGLVVLDDLGDP